MSLHAHPDCDDCFGTGEAIGYGDHDELCWVPCSCVVTGEPVRSYTSEELADRYDDVDGYDLACRDNRDAERLAALADFA